MRAKEIISSLVMPLKPSDPGSLALTWMEDLGVMHLPVVEKSNLLGMVKSSDIYNLEDIDQPLSSNNVPLIRSYVYADFHIYEVLRLAAAEKLSVIPVLDQNNQYLGCTTRGEIIQAMANFTSVTQPGGILVLEINTQQYSLSEISRLIEANDAKVLSSAVTSAADSTKLEVTIKVNVMNLSSIIQTLNRFDYIIKASFAEESQYDALLSERFESLMKFLDT